MRSAAATFATRKSTGEVAQPATNRMTKASVIRGAIFILPNVKDEPRPGLARAVLLGARVVTAPVVGSGALFGAPVSNEDEPSSACLHENDASSRCDLLQNWKRAWSMLSHTQENLASQRTSIQR